MDGAAIQKLELLIEAVAEIDTAMRQVRAMMRAMRIDARETDRDVTSAFGKMRDAFHRTLQRMGHDARQAWDGLKQRARESAATMKGYFTDALVGQAVGMGMNLASIGPAKVKEFADMGIGANKFRQETVAGLTAMTKSKAEAESLFNFLSKFADVTPFDDQEVIQAGKALRTFGFDARRDITMVGDVAKAMNRDLDSVVRVLTKAKAGQFDISEFGPLGISSEALKKQGIKFSNSGEVQNREELERAVRGVWQQFAGTMAAQGTGYEAMFSTMISNLRRVAEKATHGLFGSLTAAFKTVGEALDNLLKSDTGQRIISALAVPFNAVGKMLEEAASKLAPFLEGVGKIVTLERMQSLVANLVAVFEALRDRVTAFFAGFLPSAAQAGNWFDALNAAILEFGAKMLAVGPTAAKIWQLMREGVTDFKDHILDTVQDSENAFDRMFHGITGSFHAMMSSMLAGLAAFMSGISSMPFMDTPGIRSAITKLTAGSTEASGRASASEASANAYGQDGLTDAQREARRFRELAKDAANPKRNNPWFGRGGQVANTYTDALNAARNELAGRAGQAEDRLFGPGGRPAMSDMPPGHQFPGFRSGAPPMPAKPIAKDIEELRAAVEAAKAQFASGDMDNEGLIDAMDALNSALLEQAKGVSKNTTDAEKKWKEYYAAFNDTVKAFRSQQDKIFGDLQQRTQNVAGFIGLFGEGQQGKLQQRLMGPMLQQQRDELANTILGETDKDRQQELLGKMLGVAQQFGGLGGSEAGFGGRFGGGKNSALNFFLGQGGQAGALTNLVLNGGGEAARLVSPVERTADNTRRMADMLERVLALLASGQPGAAEATVNAGLAAGYARATGRTVRRRY